MELFLKLRIFIWELDVGAMLILLILLLVLFLLLFWLMWSPIILYINTVSNQYFFKFGMFFRVMPFYDKEELFLKLKVPFHTFRISPFRSSSKPKDRKSPKKDKEAAKKGITLLDISTMLDLIKTFSIKQFLVNIDTGDFVVNAKLTPVLLLASQGSAHLQTNFQGYTDVRIEIENRLIRFIPPIYRYIITKYL